MALICEWAGPTRSAVSWGALVCSGVDVYCSGKKHCFNLGVHLSEGHDKHTALWDHINVTFVYDYHWRHFFNSFLFLWLNFFNLFEFNSFCKDAVYPNTYVVQYPHLHIL